MLWKLIVTLALGAAAGWIAGGIMKCRGGLGRNILMGVIGSAVGGILFSLIGLSATGWIGRIIVSTVGACLCIFLARKLLKK